MKKLHLGILCITLPLAGIFLSSAFAAEKGEKQKSEKKIVGSVRPQGTLKPADLPALARISFTGALQRALAASPGAVIKAELEVEEGNLMYSFEIVGADKKVREVEIDAGDGKVLDIDED